MIKIAKPYLSNETPLPGIVEALEDAAERDSVKVLAAQCYGAALELVSRAAYGHYVQTAVFTSLEHGGTEEEYLQKALEGLRSQIAGFLADTQTSIRYLQLADAIPEGPLS